MSSSKPGKKPGKPGLLKKRPESELPFPPAWLWLVDEAIPAYVKSKYSPRDTWKDKPFSREDVRFFFKGIEELSELFTEERPRALPQYFLHPKFRSSYMLYFVPLQAAKFLALFQRHPAAIEAALEHGKETGVMRIADLGAGPGTASLALLLWLLQRASQDGKELPKIEFDWLDTQAGALEDGQTLVKQLESNFPKLRGKVTVRTHVMPWWRAASVLSKETSLIFFGNVLNESPGPAGAAALSEPPELYDDLFKLAQGGGILFVEPAFKKASQYLSILRDRLFENGTLKEEPTAIWGPCLHAGRCPLADGRDWCHFSIPVDIPGRWFREFSHGLGSERQWVKFSYLWLASRQKPAPTVDPRARRVVSDPIPSGDGATVLLCEPDSVARHSISPNSQVRRGDLITPAKLPVQG